jgi:hypothetical protein
LVGKQYFSLASPSRNPTSGSCSRDGNPYTYQHAYAGSFGDLNRHASAADGNAISACPLFHPGTDRHPGLAYGCACCRRDSYSYDYPDSHPNPDSSPSDGDAHDCLHNDNGSD